LKKKPGFSEKAGLLWFGSVDPVGRKDLAHPTKFGARGF